MNLLERIRSPSWRAVRNAGPPEWEVLAGAIVSVAVMATAWLTGILRTVPWPFWATIPVFILAIVGIADRDGWRVRRAMAYLAIEQRKRWSHGKIPTTPSGARAWLLDPANADAGPSERASALFTAGDVAAASATIDANVPVNPIESASRARLLASFRARQTGIVDMEGIEAATEGLTGEERRYQLTSAAFSQAWLDIEAGRRWRDRFVVTVRALGPYPVPLRVHTVIVAQELAAPIAVVLGTAFVSLLVGW